MPPPPDMLEAIKKGEIPGFTLDDLRRVEERKSAAGIDAAAELARVEFLPEVAPSKGTRHPIVLLGDYANVAHDPASTPAFYQELLFSDGSYPTGSMRDYYQEVSYDALDLDGTVHNSWLEVPGNRNKYADCDGTPNTDDDFGMGDYPCNSQKFVEDLLLAADPSVDFSQFADNEADLCADAADDDKDGYVNDGCPVKDTGSEPGDGPDCDLNGDGDCDDPDEADLCASAEDDDGDGYVNDGCPVVDTGADCDLNVDGDCGDSIVESLIVIHAGIGAPADPPCYECMWAHQSSLNSPLTLDGVTLQGYAIQPEYESSPGDSTIGVFAHEYGHLLGLPDLYDRDYSSPGLGEWSLMASGGNNGPWGSRPAHPDAGCKARLGWIEPIVQTLPVKGATLQAVEGASPPNVYKLPVEGGSGKEYFLIENRQLKGFDDYLPGAGLLIYHVDEGRYWTQNDDDWHPLAMVEQADDLWDLQQWGNYGDAGDPWPGSTINRCFADATAPSSQRYTGEADLCADDADDDGDGYVNDGCPIVKLASEKNKPGVGPDCDLTGTGDDDCDDPGEAALCVNAEDDDGDGYVNDGCPVVDPGSEPGNGPDCDRNQDGDCDESKPSGVSVCNISDSGDQMTADLGFDYHYFAEGFTGDSWQTFIFLMNRGDTDANVTATFNRDGADPVVKTLVVPKHGRLTIPAHDPAYGPGPGWAFGTVIESDQPLAAQQALIDSVSGLAVGGLAHGTIGSSELAANWQFAEGFTGNYWLTFISLMNPGDTDANVTATFNLHGAPPVVKDVVVPAHSRRTIRAHDPADGPGPGWAFGTVIESDQPIAAQQALIDPVGGLAHGTIGSRELAPNWQFAEGFTGNFWLTFISLMNPGDTDANVTATFNLHGEPPAPPVVKDLVVPAHSRRTIPAHDPAYGGPGPGWAFGTVIESDQPIAAQQALIDPVGGLAHGTIGAKGLAPGWQFAEGRTDWGMLTFFALMNPGDTDANVTATFNLDGAPPVVKNLVVPPHSRRTIPAHDPAYGPGPGWAFGTVIESDQPIAAQQVLILIDPAQGWAVGTIGEATETPPTAVPKNTMAVLPADSGPVDVGSSFSVGIHVVAPVELPYTVVGAQLEWEAAGLELLSHSSAGSIVGFPQSPVVGSGDPPGTEEIRNMGGLMPPGSPTGLVWTVELRCDVEGTHELHLVPIAEDALNGTATAETAGSPHPMVLEDGQVNCAGVVPEPTATDTPVAPEPTATDTPVVAKNTMAVVPADSGPVDLGNSFSVEIHVVDVQLPYTVVGAQLEWEAAGLELLSHSSVGSIVGFPQSPVPGSGEPPGTEEIRNMGGLMPPGSPTGLVWTVELTCDAEGTYELHLVPVSEDPLNGTATAETAGSPHPMVLEDGAVSCEGVVS